MIIKDFGLQLLQRKNKEKDNKEMNRRENT